MHLAPVELIITSYEVQEDGTPSPTLSHIFYGKTAQQALELAKSHIITDYFFLSTFFGEMTWKNDKILIEYDGQFMGTKKFSENKLKEAFRELEKRAEKIKKIPEHKKIVQSIQILSHKKFRL